MIPPERSWPQAKVELRDISTGGTRTQNRRHGAIQSVRSAAGEYEVKVARWFKTVMPETYSAGAGSCCALLETAPWSSDGAITVVAGAQARPTGGRGTLSDITTA